VGAALMLSMSASHAIPSPFAGFNGSLSGTGMLFAFPDEPPNTSDARADYRSTTVVGGGPDPEAEPALLHDASKFAWQRRHQPG